MKQKVFALFFVFVFLLTAGAGCSLGQPIKLDSVEIKSYNGQNLSPIANMPLVSIKGTQHVDISTYHLDITGLADAPQSYTYDQVKNFANYQKVVTLFCVEGWNAKILWQAVWLGISLIKPSRNHRPIR